MKVNPWITRVGLLLILLVVAGFCWASPQNASASPVQQAGSPLPTPRVSIYFYPTLPSTADYVSFYANVDDPLGWWGYTYMWVFGDGSSSADVYGYASHQYAAEGKYTVSLTVTSSDGRIGTVAVTFVVENHDVWISKVTTPSQASAGQVKQISVVVNSKKYDDTVWVYLYTGWQQIGASRQLVLAKDKGKGTPFTFNYRFTAADAAAGVGVLLVEQDAQRRVERLPSELSRSRNQHRRLAIVRQRRQGARLRALRRCVSAHRHLGSRS